MGIPADQGIHELLPWYVAGTLDSRMAEEFREHLHGCDACRREMAFLERMQRALESHGEAFLEDHPSSEQVVAAARGELVEPEASQVRKHVALCGSCATETGWVVGDAVYEGEIVRRPTTPSPAPARSWGWRIGLAAALLIAAFQLLILFRPDGVGTVVIRPQHVLSTQRDAGAPTRVVLEPGHSTIRMVFQVDLPGEAYPVSATLRDGASREVFRATGIGRDSLLDGYLYLDCAREDCPVGSYTLRILAPDGTAPELSFNFEVVEP